MTVRLFVHGDTTCKIVSIAVEKAVSVQFGCLVRLSTFAAELLPYNEIPKGYNLHAFTTAQFLSGDACLIRFVSIDPMISKWC